MTSHTTAPSDEQRHGGQQGTNPQQRPPTLALHDPAAGIREYRGGLPPGERAPAGLPPRPPWSWSLYAGDGEAGEDALVEVVHGWVVAYNQQLALKPEHLIPRCWPAHAGLAAELAVWAWYWHDTHLTAESPDKAAEFYSRHLPAFRERINPYLGTNPEACRRGEHPDNWHRKIDEWLPADGAHDHPTHRDQLTGSFTTYRYGFEPRNHTRQHTVEASGATADGRPG